MVKLYLAHPIDERLWIREKELEIEKETNVELLNPFYDTGRDDVYEIDAGKKTRWDESLDYVAIVNKDLALIHECDGIVAFIGEHPSIGTTCELWFTLTSILLEETQRPIYIVSEKFSMHPWIRYMIKVSNGKTFKNYDEFKEYIKVK